MVFDIVDVMVDVVAVDGGEPDDEPPVTPPTTELEIGGMMPLEMLATLD